MLLLCVSLILGFLLQPAAYDWPTLGDQLKHYGVPAEGIADRARRITSFAVASDADWFAIAYYWHDGTNVLPTELRIRTFDRHGRRWRSVVLNSRDESRAGGSVTRIARRGGWLYLDTHINPSAGSLLVLSPNLTMRKRLYGWSTLVLPDGRVVYQNSMRHFAPAHPGSLSLYDPSRDQDVPLYPANPDPASVMIDRSIGMVTLTSDSRIRFEVVEEDRAWGPDQRTVPSGPRRSFTVTCDLAQPTPSCWK